MRGRREQPVVRGGRLLAGAGAGMILGCAAQLLAHGLLAAVSIEEHGAVYWPAHLGVMVPIYLSGSVLVHRCFGATTLVGEAIALAVRHLTRFAQAFAPEPNAPSTRLG